MSYVLLTILRLRQLIFLERKLFLHKKDMAGYFPHVKDNSVKHILEHIYHLLCCLLVLALYLKSYQHIGQTEQESNSWETTMTFWRSKGRRRGIDLLRRIGGQMFRCLQRGIRTRSKSTHLQDLRTQCGAACG
jgi:hypothetical protein